MDAVQAANSGHPGTPMGLAPVAYSSGSASCATIPSQPIWPNRDRFVLSCGHASMLLYSLLHLAGVKAVNPDYETLDEPSLPLDDIKRFRQLDSPCPAIPSTADDRRRDHHRPARPASRTASAWRSPQRWLAASYNRPGFELFDFDVYALPATAT